jgi:hypothetical protein
MVRCSDALMVRCSDGALALMVACVRAEMPPVPRALPPHHPVERSCPPSSPSRVFELGCHQFLVQRTNKRDDEWGGSFANRSRLATTIVRRVREATSPGFIVMFRLSMLDLVDKGSDWAEVKPHPSLDPDPDPRLNPHPHFEARPKRHGHH